MNVPSMPKGVTRLWWWVAVTGGEQVLSAQILIGGSTVRPVRTRENIPSPTRSEAETDLNYPLRNDCFLLDRIPLNLEKEGETAALSGLTFLPPAHKVDSAAKN